MKLIAALFCVAVQSVNASTGEDTIQSCLDGRPTSTAVSLKPLLKNTTRTLIEEDDFKPGFKAEYYETTGTRVGKAERAGGGNPALLFNDDLYPLEKALVARGKRSEIEAIRMDSSDWLALNNKGVKYLCVRFVADHGVQNFVKGYLLQEGVPRISQSLIFISGCTSDCKH